ncbi:MAG: hypothetical protein ABSF73_01365 [Terriglobia bacterium]|jgi:hypothetical protein
MMNPLANLALSVGQTLLHEAGRLLFGIALGRAKELLRTPQQLGTRQLALNRALQKKAVDGALLAGPRTGKEYAKFTLKKGLPTDQRPRTMAVENEPHSVDDFNGVIKEGYGKGEKRLIYSGTGVIKVGGSRQLGKINVHEHDAEKAGFHYDFVAEGVDPHTEFFEVNIANGVLKGRYAFRQAFEENHYLVVRLKDDSVLVEKPDIHLKPPEFLKTIRQSDRPVSVEWKDDGSLANVAIHNLRAVYRSHRPEGEPYYDKLPAIEDLRNRSPVWLARRLFPGPEQEGTVLRGELHHPDGAARVGGILNALPEKSIKIQQERGPVEFYAWDIAKFKGRDVNQMPYGQRRELYEAVIEEVRLFNRHLHIVPAMPEGGDPVEFYRAIIHDARGLPWSEGVVVKYQDSPNQWFKVKANDTLDVRVIRCLEGAGKFAASLGAMVVEGPTGVQSEIGSFQLTNEQRQWIWDHRDVLTGQIAEVRALTVNESGAIRAGVFVRFHPSRSEQGLLLYSESLAGSTDPDESRQMMFRLKSSAGWRR